MELNDLLGAKRIDPRKVIVMRHRPKEKELNKVLPLLAADKPKLFNAYQQTQNERVEKAMTTAKYVASFVGQEPGKATFVGLYKIGRAKSITYKGYWTIPAHIELREQGMRGFTGEKRTSCLWFDLKLMHDFYPSWKGKLIVDWPPTDRGWWRRAHKNKILVHAILEDSALDTAMKKWNEIDLTWNQLTGLPKRWQITLEQWRGIYYIFDTSDRRGYVGSASGTENLFGRWCNYRHASSYASSGHGGNRLLRGRDPKNFHFTILELVSQNMDRDEVIKLENTWKERLHTRKEYGGLNDN